jgi:hypothetical protein
MDVAESGDKRTDARRYVSAPSAGSGELCYLADVIPRSNKLELISRIWNRSTSSGTVHVFKHLRIERRYFVGIMLFIENLR